MSSKRTSRTGNRNKGARTLAQESRPLKVIYRPIAALQIDPGNPRVHSEKQIQQIAASIRNFGFVVPVLVNGAGRIIAGHGRVLAARHLGFSQVPTVSVEYLSEAQARALALADNRISLSATWNEQLLAEQLQSLSVPDLDFRLEDLGFETTEIDLLLEGLKNNDTQGKDAADALPVPSSGPPVSKVGDLWLLGPHRVLCGNALEERDYKSLLGSRRAAAILTDPPYNVPIQGNVSGLGKRRHREFVMASGEMSEAQFTAFLTQVLGLLARHSADGSLHYIFMDWKHLMEILTAGRKAYSELKNMVVWVKDNAGMGSQYRSQHELVFVFKNGTGKHRNNIELGRHGRYRTNVWQYPGANSFAGRNTGEGDVLAWHPSVKSVALIADAILDCTARDEIVLDAFLGSGTTVIAAARTGRVCFGLELDPLYVDTTVRRWQAFAGKQAKHAASGCLFDDLEKEARHV